jgi:hypothetical protein
MHRTSLAPTTLLRLALLGDAAASGATGLLLVTVPGPLAAVFGLPQPLLLAAALILLPYTAVVAWLGGRPMPPRAAVRVVIVVNLLWTADSIALLALGPAFAHLAPTALGMAFVLFQAAVVAGFAVAQLIGLRRTAAEATARAYA